MHKKNIALRLLCCICFGFGLFPIHLGRVSHAEKKTNIALGLFDCICLVLDCVPSTRQSMPKEHGSKNTLLHLFWFSWL